MHPARTGSIGSVVVPFGGFEHDWAALELGAWFARGASAPLRLIGPVGDPSSGKRDSSRLLARASLIVQRFTNVPAEPILTRPGVGVVVEAARDGALLVIGLASRWRLEGLGRTRTEIAARADSGVVFATSGTRPGGLAPEESLTRFTWSLGETVD